MGCCSAPKKKILKTFTGCETIVQIDYKIKTINK